MNESFRVPGPSATQGVFAFLDNAPSAPVMDVIGGEHRDSAMVVLGVVPGEEGPAEGGRGAAMPAKRPGKPGWYFRVLNCASEKGLSSLTGGRLRERVMPT